MAQSKFVFLNSFLAKMCVSPYFLLVNSSIVHFFFSFLVLSREA